MRSRITSCGGRTSSSGDIYNVAPKLEVLGRHKKRSDGSCGGNTLRRYAPLFAFGEQNVRRHAIRTDRF
jgi:hypothetical protein